MWNILKKIKQYLYFFGQYNQMIEFNYKKNTHFSRNLKNYFFYEQKLKKLKIQYLKNCI